jgi:hypothetical protein
MRLGFLVSTVVAGSVALSLASTSCSAKGASSKNDTTKSAAVAMQLKPQTTCPVMGEAIDKSVFFDCNGKRIYMCCTGCLAKVKADPQKYIDKLASMGQSVEVLGAPSGTAVAPTDTSAKAPGTAAQPGTAPAEAGYWTCSMHPEIHAAAGAVVRSAAWR